jgi:GH15 family glucan-1,4-alpha-glucosidase
LDFQPIENYAVIGNMRSVALISLAGSIDFLCYPDFDSPSVFAALLDRDGGCFSIEPQLEGMRTKQMYLPETNILLTRFLSDQGVAEVTDFMPVVEHESADKPYFSQIVRILRVVGGDVDFKVRCAPRFNYARSAHGMEHIDGSVIFHPDEKGCPDLSLSATVPLKMDGDAVTAQFSLKSGETAFFVFGECGSGERKCGIPLDRDWIEQQFQATSHYWQGWLARSNYKGRWREMVGRSALLLKLLTSAKYGPLVAAPTFGLPELPGGERNWDYRYTWLRDTSFSLYALTRLGYVQETERFTEWLRDRLHEDAEHGPLQVMYRLDGSQDLDESILENFSGYRDSRPVRIGNGAHTQLQLDIYGEMLDAIYLSNKYGDGISHEDWNRVIEMLDWLDKNWSREDDGIWEVRGGQRQFLHSRLMCWVAFDRGIRLADKRSLTGPIADWMEARDAIHDDIHANFWNEDIQAFVQSRGSSDLDASVLLMPMMRFISPVDPRWLSTLKAIEDHLTEDSLVYRYDTNRHIDGLRGKEGSFTACSFWFVECLARAHQVDKARLLFEKMLGFANHVGLYSEELGLSGEHLGNFPQALTHLALISAATYLDRELSGNNKMPWH